MAAENLNSFALQCFDYGLRRDAHQLLAWGYQDALHKIHCKLEEEEITGLIVAAMREKLKDINIPERFYDRYSVAEEKPLAVDGRTGKRRLKLDIVIESKFPHKVRPEYIFEAKRLQKNGFPIGEYVGEDGLQCFVKGVYASQYIEAAMVGYDQSGNAIYWEKELRRRFDNDLNNDLCIKQLLQKAQVLSSLNEVWTSEHEREENDSIVIYHIFLDCSAAPE